LQHKTNVALAIGFPVAFVLSPSFLAWPVDMLIGAVIPLHMYIGCVHVIQDYIPKPYQSPSRLLMLLAAVFTFFGLLKVNMCGPGIIESIKSLWRENPNKKSLKE